MFREVKEKLIELGVGKLIVDNVLFNLLNLSKDDNFIFTDSEYELLMDMIKREKRDEKLDDFLGE
jgi:hypothetical protein